MRGVKQFVLPFIMTGCTRSELCGGHVLETIILMMGLELTHVTDICS